MNHLTEKGRLRLRLRLHPIALAAAAFALASHCAHAQHSSTALPAWPTSPAASTRGRCRSIPPFPGIEDETPP